MALSPKFAKPKWWNPFSSLTNASSEEEISEDETALMKGIYKGQLSAFLDDCEIKKDYYFKERKDLELDENNIIHFLNEIENEKDWLTLSIVPKDSHLANIRSMKVIIDISDNNIVYLLNSYFYIYHYRFYHFWIYNRYLEETKTQHEKQAKLVKDGVMDVTTFNQKQYKRNDRDYALFSIHHYKDHDCWCLELWSDDNMSKEMITKCYKLLRSKLYFADKFYFHPISNVHISNCPDQETDDVLIAGDLFANVKVQLLVPGECYGKLMFFKQGRKFDFSQESIVVCESIPLDITPVSGIISSVIQTPLCHLTLLCSNRKTPNITVIDSYLSLRKYENKWMRLEVSGKSYSLEESDEKTYLLWKSANETKNNNNSSEKIILESPNMYDKLIRFDKGVPSHLTKNMRNVIGSKAEVLMKLKRIDLRKKCFQSKKLRCLPGFIIPFGVFLKYKKHVIEKLDEKFPKISMVEKFKKIPFYDDLLFEDIWNTMRILFGSSEVFPIKIIMRSSTNVEDIKGFNGAGLYDSLSCIPEKKNFKQVFSKTITDIFCSLYTDRAIKEREFFRIDETNISMAILIQPFFKAPVNGVCLSCNPYGKNYPTFFVNVQKGVLVTDTNNNVIPEQWLMYYTGDVLPSFELVSRMKEHDKPSMSIEGVICDDNVLLKIYEMIRLLRKIFKKEMGYLDIEFLVTEKIEGEQEVVILQCRPYTGYAGEKLY